MRKTVHTFISVFVQLTKQVSVYRSLKSNTGLRLRPRCQNGTCDLTDGTVSVNRFDLEISVPSLFGTEVSRLSEFTV